MTIWIVKIVLGPVTSHCIVKADNPAEAYAKAWNAVQDADRESVICIEAKKFEGAQDVIE